MGLHCCNQQHTGPHFLRLDDRIGGSGPTVRSVARTAILHAFDGEEDVPEVALAEQVLDRLGDPPVTDEEAAALIAAVESGREYMLANHYASDFTFPEDAAAAIALETCIWVDTCWARI